MNWEPKPGELIYVWDMGRKHIVRFIGMDGDVYLTESATITPPPKDRWPNAGPITSRLRSKE